MIEFKNVSKLYKEKAALRNINMTIACGEFFVLVGTSGSGKTTTLKMINRLLTPTEGTVSINSVDVQQSELRIALKHRLCIAGRRFIPEFNGM